MKLHKYESYEEYKAIQVKHNHRKLTSVWEWEVAVEFISKCLKEFLGEVTSGICHGTRGGKEQEWFRKYLDGADVIGTEISDTATQFPHTVEWDFHEVKEEWISSFDFVFSNAFDHAYDPEKALKAWASCLKPGGYLILHWSTEHNETGSKRDPFAATLGEYIDMLSALGFDLRDIRKTPRMEAPSFALFFTKGANLQTVIRDDDAV